MTTRTAIPDRGAYAGADLATRLMVIRPMLADGWTSVGALAHIEGACDRAVCCGWEHELKGGAMSPASEALRRIRELAETAERALADEQERAFVVAVGELGHEVGDLVAMVKSW